MDPLATRRVHMLARLAFVWAALIVGRLIQLQIVQHGEYQRLAQQQQEKRGDASAPRGAILDRLRPAPGDELARRNRCAWIRCACPTCPWPPKFFRKS